MLRNHYRLLKHLTLFAVLLALALTFYVLFIHKSTTAASQEPPLTSVVAAFVIQDQFIEQIEALGTTKANESVYITANVTEKVNNIHFHDGMLVEENDILVVLDKAEEDAQLASAVAHFTEQERELKRLKQLVERRTIPQAQYDERETMYEIAQFSIKEAQARVKNRVIRAPFSGRLGLRNVSVGTLISPGDVITTLDDIDIIKLDFTVPTNFLSAVKVGMPIIAVSDAYTQRFIGELTTINSRIDPVTRSVTVRAEIPNSEGLLKPGMLMKVTLIKDARETLIIPEAALVPEQEKNFVFVIDPDQDYKIIRQAVKIGGRRPAEVEILDGLELGQWIVVRGTTRVRPGEHVMVTNRDKLTAPEHNV